MKAQKTIATLTGTLVLFLALAAFTLSFDALRNLAHDNGINPALTWLVPLVIDGAIIAFALSILRANLYTESARWPWILSITFTLLSVIFNVLHARMTITAQVLAAIPPVALFLSFETLMGQLKMSVKRGQVGATLALLSTQVQGQQAELDKLAGDLSRLAERKAAALAELEDIRQQIKVTNPGSGALPVEELNERKQDKIAERRARVLELLEAGQSPEDIAGSLKVSPRTIKRDLSKLNGKAHAILEGRQ